MNKGGEKLNGKPDPLPIGVQEMTAARELLERYLELSPRDAIHLGGRRPGD